MHSRIPMERNDNPQFKDVMDYWYKLKQAQTQREQYAQTKQQQKEQFDQTKQMQKEQFDKTYGLNQQIQSRANQLFPMVVQKYQDDHNRAATDNEKAQIHMGISRYIRDGLLASNQGQAPQENAAQDEPQVPLVNIPDAPSIDLSKAAYQPQVEQDEQQTYTPITGFPIPQQGRVSGIAPQIPAQAAIEQPDFNPAAMTQSGGAPIPPPTQGGMNQGMQAQGGMAAQMPGQEYELKAGNPRLSRLDEVAGLVPEVPAPKVHFAPNGNVITRYPSGRVTVQNMGNIPGMAGGKETPQQRQTRETRTRIDAATGIENEKAASKLQTSGRELATVATRALKIKKLVEENPGMTGLMAGGLSSLNLSQSKKLAEFDQTTRKLQADMAKYGSTRGGAQALKWAERSKPGTYRQDDYNLGMIQSIYDDAKSDYDEMAAEYKERTGKDYPVSFPEMPEYKSDGNKSEGGGSKKEKVTLWNLVDGKLVKG